MSRLFRFIVLAGLIFSAGCASLEPLLASLTPPTVVPTKRATSTPVPAATQTQPVRPETPLLRVWVTPQFDPGAQTAPANLLKQRFADFEAQHPGVRVEVRVKQAEGEEAIVNVLSLTRAAAPAALPDLVLLSRPDLEDAALKGLLHPIDGLSTLLEDPDWYSYAQQLGRIQNTGYGLPFVGNTLIFVYYPELGTLVSWDDVFKSRGQLVFPAGNLQGLVGLSLYSSAGGEILDAQGSPTLDAEALTRTLMLVQKGVSKNVFPSSLTNVSTDAQALQIYRSGSANKGIMWIIDYHPPSDGEIAPVPGLDGTSFSYATGWLWALAGSNPENQQLAVELAEYLVATDFVGEWTHAAGYLPTRPSSVGTNDRIMTAVTESAHPLPSNDVLAALGPLMEEALTRVLNGEQPKDVAESVVQKLK